MRLNLEEGVYWVVLNVCCSLKMSCFGLVKLCVNWWCLSYKGAIIIVCMCCNLYMYKKCRTN